MRAKEVSRNVTWLKQQHSRRSARFERRSERVERVKEVNALRAAIATSLTNLALDVANATAAATAGARRCAAVGPWPKDSSPKEPREKRRDEGEPSWLTSVLLMLVAEGT